MSTETVTIRTLGAKGDGIADSELGGGPVFVPFTLPGERVAIARNGNQGTVMSMSQISPERRTPPCRHFGPEGKNGTCGGCTLQHVGDEAYHAFKRQVVVDALAQRGVAAEVDPLVIARPGERRRLVLSARRTEKGILLGFNQMESHHIVAIEECPIAVPQIVGRLPAIRSVAAMLARDSKAFRIAVLDTQTGLDLAVERGGKLGDGERRRAIDTVLGLSGIARLTVDGETLVEPQKPTIDFSGIAVFPPAGSFAQATKPAEEAMAALVLAHLGKAKRIADLFAGAGTFALRLAKHGRVHAVESDGPALAALDQAARRAQGLKPVTVERRDLFRRPLTVQELKVFDGLSFDPPRAGAEDQCRELARSSVSRIAAISCNPQTLARDLSILIAGGYRVTKVMPIDQFLWSPHVEAVALLERS